MSMIRPPGIPTGRCRISRCFILSVSDWHSAPNGLSGKRLLSSNNCGVSKSMISDSILSFTGAVKLPRSFRKVSRCYLHTRTQQHSICASSSIINITMITGNVRCCWALTRAGLDLVQRVFLLLIRLGWRRSAGSVADLLRRNRSCLADFIYAMIDAYGGPGSFYRDLFYLLRYPHSGLHLEGKNINYYDVPKLRGSS